VFELVHSVDSSVRSAAVRSAAVRSAAVRSAAVRSAAVRSAAVRTCVHSFHTRPIRSDLGSCSCIDCIDCMRLRIYV